MYHPIFQSRGLHQGMHEDSFPDRCKSCVRRKKWYRDYHKSRHDDWILFPYRIPTSFSGRRTSWWECRILSGICFLPVSLEEKDDTILEKFDGVTKAFFKQLPEDNIPYWDMIFTEGNEMRDTSAAAIAICGILEMEKYVPNQEFKAKAVEMLEALVKNQTTKGLKDSNGLIMNSLYNRNRGHQQECSMWGDYYTMEALHRIKKTDRKTYW